MLPLSPFADAIATKKYTSKEPKPNDIRRTFLREQDCNNKTAKFGKAMKI